MEALSTVNEVAARLLLIERRLRALNDAFPVGGCEVFDDAVENGVLQYAVFVVVQEILQNYLKDDSDYGDTIMDSIHTMQERSAAKRRQMAEQLVSDSPVESGRVSEEII